MSILDVQRKLQQAGYDPGPLDGQWGARTAAALDAALQLDTARHASLAWGACVSEAFRRTVFEICDDLQVLPDYLMACMAWESAESFRSDIVNMAGSGATGLIQFMPATARDLGTSTGELAGMTPERQLYFVHKYFKPWRGRLKSLSDVYMAILWPAGIGKPESHALWTKATRPTTYRQNAGLDINRDGAITKGEAAAKVQEKLVRGLHADRIWRAA